MSTKIYNGFCVNAGSAHANLQLLGRLKSAVQGLVDKKHSALVAQRLVHKVDVFCVNAHSKEPLHESLAEIANSSIWWTVVDKLHEEQRECRRSQERSPLVDCDVELFLRLDPESGKLLGYLQEERVGVHSLLLQSEGIEDYGYWNNTDKPDDVTEEAWEERAAAWNRVLDSEDIAVLSMRWEPSFESREAVLAALPSMEERATRRARDHLMHLALVAHRQAHPEEAETASMSGVMRVIRETERELAKEDSELHQQALALAATFRTQLVERLDDHLFNRFCDLPGLPAQDCVN